MGMDRRVTSVERGLEQMALNFQELQDRLAEQDSVVGSTVELLASLTQRVSELSVSTMDNGALKAELSKLANHVQTNTAALANAVAANTSAEAEAPAVQAEVPALPDAPSEPSDQVQTDPAAGDGVAQGDGGAQPNPTPTE